MKIAVSDACIFIDFLEIDLVDQFFNLPLELHTSLDVYNELFTEQREILEKYIVTGKLTIHNISAGQWQEILELNFPKAISPADRTAIYLAQKLDAILLSSDKPVRHNAKIRHIEYHGSLWILDQLVESNELSTSTACDKIKLLFRTNSIYQNNSLLIEEMNKRLSKWQ